MAYMKDSHVEYWVRSKVTTYYGLNVTSNPQWLKYLHFPTKRCRKWHKCSLKMYETNITFLTWYVLTPETSLFVTTNSNAICVTKHGYCDVHCLLYL